MAEAGRVALATHAGSAGALGDEAATTSVASAAVGSCTPVVAAALRTTAAVALTAADIALSFWYYPFHFAKRVVCTAQRGLYCSQLDLRSLSVVDTAQTVVIVGANFGGLSAARQLCLNPHLRVVLVDQRDYFEYTPGILRALCDPAAVNSLARPLPNWGQETVVGRATDVCSDHVMVSCESGSRRLDFDYLVMATGADYRQPITARPAESSLEARKEVLAGEADKLRAASEVLILGAGAVGAELAAEIACHYPQKRVTVVDANERVVPVFPQATSEYVQRWLDNHGVQVLLGQRLSRWDESGCTLADGTRLNADIVYVCFGMSCNSQAVGEGDLAGALGQRRQMKVNDHLQVLDHPRAYAVGDVMEQVGSAEIKQAYFAEAHGHVAAANIERAAAGRPLLRYPQDVAGAPVMPLVYVVSLGRYDGSLGFNGIVVNGALTAGVKWVIEWTKVREMEGRPIGMLVWWIGDASTYLLSRIIGDRTKAAA